MMRRVIWALAAISAVSIPARAAGPLDGTVWTMRATGIRRVAFWKSDQLIFKDGAFISASAQAQGFAPAAYAVLNASEGRWIATIARLEGDQIVWEGKVNGEKMTGEYTRIRRDGSRTMVPWSAKLASYAPPVPAPTPQAEPVVPSSPPPAKP